MSEGNEGEEKQNDNSEEEFQFYFAFTKPLVLELLTEEDRALAAAWVQKLEAEPNTQKEKEDRLNYLKLLLFVLQRGQLSGIFARQPPSGPLHPFPQGLNVLEIGNLMLEQDDDLLYGGGDTGHVPYIMELSNDLKEYVASQEVPNFGIQMYYAWSSNEPVHKWSLFDEEKFPKYILEKIKQIKPAKYDEKSQGSIDICGNDKTGCNFPVPELLSPESVKSPEAMEKSQGRSFLTYMGLVGRMGNFNEKCDENPERFSPRQNIPRKSSAKRKKCPGNGGVEDAGQEDFDVFVTALGGELNAMNRPCLCPNPIHQGNCPPQQPKRRPQSSCLENIPVNNCSDNDNAQWSSPGRMRDPCYDGNMSGMLPQQRNGSRSASLNRRGMTECPPEGNSGGFQNQGEVCICTSPPCTCPCPRAPHKSPGQKAGPSGAGGRVRQSPSRTGPRPARQDAVDCNPTRNRGIGTQLTSFQAPEQCTPTTPGSIITPTGGRTCEGAGSLRPVLHCYDNQNPDPTLTKTIEKNDGWLPLAGGGVKYVDTEFKIASTRDQLIARAMENKCKLNARRGLFNSPQPGPSGINRMRPQNDCPPPSSSSPPLLTHPLCDYLSPVEDDGFSQQPCPPNFQEFQGGREPQMYRPSCAGRINTNTQKKSQPQSSSRLKSNCQAGGSFAVNNESGRLANMNNVLRILKQKAEAHREKGGECAPPRASPNDGCYGGIQSLTQTKQCPRQTEQRNLRDPGYCEDNERMPRNMMSDCGGYQAPPSSPQAPRIPYQNRVSEFGNYFLPTPGRNFGSPVLPPDAYEFNLYNPSEFQQPDCDPCYENEEDDEDECDSGESMEDPCQNIVEDHDETLSEPCLEALNRRNQDYYTLTYEEESPLEPQECRQAPNFSLVNDTPYPGLPSTQVEFVGTMLSANDTDCDPQWVSPRRTGMKNQIPSGRNLMVNDNRAVGSTRISPGRASQRVTTFNGLQGNNAGQFNELCAQNTGQVGRRKNRYAERSDLAYEQPSCSQPTRQPLSSTPLRNPRETFKDRGCEDLSNINF